MLSSMTWGRILTHMQTHPSKLHKIISKKFIDIVINFRASRPL